MSTHETEREQAPPVPAPQPSVSPNAPSSELLQLASIVGNRAFGQVIARQAAPPDGRPDGKALRPDATSMLARSMPELRSRTASAVARQPAPVKVEIGQAILEEPEEPGLNDSQKGRMTAMCVVPIRSAAGKLAAGEKADVRSVVRHLRPVQSALKAFDAKGPTRQTILSAAEEVSVDTTVLDSLNLSDKQAISLARAAWQTARRQIAATKAQLKAPKLSPPNDIRAIEEGRAHLDALSQQVAATIQDLVEAPRTQEGFKQVMDTAGQLIEQFDSFGPVADQPVPASFVAARKAMFDGIARIAPLALGKAAAVKEVQAGLSRVANELAGLSGAEVEKEPEPEPHDPVKGPDPGEPGKEPEDAVPPPGPAPSPNPLPPPPPPPPEPGTGAGSRAGPAPVGP